MKFTARIAFVLAVLITVTSCLSVFALADESSGAVSDSGTVAAKPTVAELNSAIAYSIDDEQFLFTKNADSETDASIATKLVTVMVAMDLFKANEKNPEDTEIIYTDIMKSNAGVAIDFRIPMKGLKVGDSYSAKDLMGFVIIAGHNDAAVALACYCGENFLKGGITEFVKEMNKKAKSLGLEKTVFLNPTGVQTPGQVSTLREICKIATAFYAYNDFITISNSVSFSGIHNRNFLKSDRYVKGFLNDDAIGIAGGQLNKDGNYCLITASQKEGRTYLFVVTSPVGIKVESIDGRNYYSLPEGNAYVDMSALIKWTRESFKLITVAKKTDMIGELKVNLGSSSDHVMICPETDSEKLVLNIDGGELTKVITYNPDLVYKRVYDGREYDTIDAPIGVGVVVGTVTYLYNGVELVTLNAVTMTAIESDSVMAWLDNAKSFLFGSFMKTVLWIIGIAVVAYVVVSIVGVVYRFVNGVRPDQKKKRKKKPVKKASKPANNGAKSVDIDKAPENVPNPATENTPEDAIDGNDSENISQ